MEGNRLTSGRTLSAIGSAGKKPAFDFTSLVSQPDQDSFDNFNQHASQSAAADPTTIIVLAGRFSLKQEIGRPRVLISPPVSPQAQGQSAAGAVDVNPLTTHAIKDPPVNIREDVAPSPPPQPLFPINESIQHQHQRLISEHIAHRDATQFRSSEPPQPKEYDLVLQVKSQTYSRDHPSSMQKGRQLLVNDRKNHDRLDNKQCAPIPPTQFAARRTSLARAASQLKSPTAKLGHVMKPSRAWAVRVTPRPHISPTGGRKSAATEFGRRQVVPSRGDRDFEALPDFCPPLESLPTKLNGLKVDWKASPVNLSQDPHAHLLHPDELSLAAKLRLDCATYLTSKRRIFISRRNYAHQGKVFLKTDAQKACNIDVNKASKLWTAFKKVGWLDMC